MRVSIWRQDKKGARWYRIGVIVCSASGSLPFTRAIPHGDDHLVGTWPRICWYSLERHGWELFDRERKE